MSAAGRTLLVAAVVLPVLLWIAGELYNWIEHRRHPPFGDAFEQMDRRITLVLLLWLGATLAGLGGIALLAGALL